jgi:HEAT repeat protein
VSDTLLARAVVPLPVGRRLALLAAQATALGLMVAWVTIPATAIFVEHYGASQLPWTYIGAAATGVVVSVALSAAFRRRPLVSVTIVVTFGLAAALGVAYVGLEASGPWVSAPLIVLVPILIPVGFMFVVGQAGEMLDLRVLKVSYARVVAGFALGFVLGGLAAPAVIGAAGGTNGLLAAAAVVSTALAVIVVLTRRLVPELAAPPPVEPHVGRNPPPSTIELLRDPFILLITAFQMLSAVESQWLDYLVYDRAARRYESSQALAEFVGHFTAIAYGSDFLVLLLVAGVVLRRFGVRTGLTVHSIAVFAVLLATIVASAALGTGSTPAFVLIVATRVTDLTMSDGASRTSLGAAYQAIPARERLACQAMVEGLAVPVAIGFSGVGLLIIDRVTGTAGLTLPVLTGVIVFAWILVALAVFRGYRVNLLANLRHRTLDAAELTIDDANTLAAVERLLDSDDERDVRLGINALRSAGHPHLVERLLQLVTDDRPGLRSFALVALRSVDPEAAAMAARAGLDHPDPAIRTASVTALATFGDSSCVPAIVRHWHDRSAEVRVAAAWAIARLGDGYRLHQLSSDLRGMAESDDPGERLLAARVLAADVDARLSRSTLPWLLDDDDARVAAAALAAVQWPADEACADRAVRHLDRRETAGDAVAALGRGGEPVLQLVDGGLANGSSWSATAQMAGARVARLVGSRVAAEVLARHLDHHDRDVGLAVARQLAELLAAFRDGDRSATGDRRAPTEAILDVSSGVSAQSAAALAADVQHTARVLWAVVVLEQAGRSATVARVARAAHDEFDLQQRRVMALLAVRYGMEEVGRVAFQLAQSDTRLHALAMEWLDVTLAGPDRAAMSVVDPALSTVARWNALGRELRADRSTVDDVLLDLVADPSGRWRRPWLSACALLAAFDRSAPWAAGWTPIDSHPGSILLETASALLHRRNTTAHITGFGPVGLGTSQ